jgi:8-oxo-dGTP diphosphatase
MLYLVRHAKAGSRSHWVGDDRLRPLSAKGRAQSEALAARLAPLVTGDLVSSPYLRCIETLQPLAARLDTAVRTDERLAENTGFAGTVDLLGELPDGSVLSSHGDVIPDTISALQRRGTAVLSEPDWRKASVWVLERDTDGSIGAATVWAPPGE